jgi:hypothetical protein
MRHAPATTAAWTLLAVLAAVLLPAAAAAAAAAPAPAPERRVPIGLNGLPQAGNADSEKTPKDHGLNFLHEMARWEEPAPGEYPWPKTGEPDPWGKRLADLKADGYTISVTMANVHMDQKHMPAYLGGAPFDDPRVLERWAAFLTVFLERYGDSIDFLNIGNEVNNYFGKFPAEWPAYVKFMAAGRAVAKKLKPKIRVGTVLVEDGREKFWASIAPLCDHLAVTYYAPCSMFGKMPAADALDPEKPGFFGRTLDAALALAGDKPLLITEIGCATHPSLDSSPAVQARFIAALFDWLRARGGRVAGLSWLSERDWPYEATRKALAGQLDAALLKHEPFMRFLTSLGLRDENGKDKPGYAAFRQSIARYRAAD